MPVDAAIFSRVTLARWGASSASQRLSLCQPSWQGCAASPCVVAHPGTPPGCLANKPFARGSSIRLIGRGASFHFHKVATIAHPCPSHGSAVSATALNATDASIQTRPSMSTPSALACSTLRTGEGRQPSLFIITTSPRRPGTALGAATVAIALSARKPMRIKESTDHGNTNG